jgi:hypothetical protein
MAQKKAVKRSSKQLVLQKKLQALLQKKKVLAVPFVLLFAGAGYLTYVNLLAAAVPTPIVGIGGKCLDNYRNLPNEGNKIEYWHCNDGDAQNWIVSGVGTVGPIMNVNGFCLTATGVTEKSYLTLNKCVGSDAQKWTYDATTHTIVNPPTGFCMADPYANLDDGTAIWMTKCNGKDQQKWTPTFVAPTIGLTNPLDTSKIAGTVSLSSNFNAPAGVTKVEYYANNTLIGTATTAPFGFAWSTPAVPDGTYSLMARAYDKLGQAGNAPAVSVTVANTVPKTTLELATYNLLNAELHPGASVDTAGGCDTSTDTACIKKRTALQAKIILGNAGNPQLDLIGTQETSPSQFRTIRGMLPGYASIPSNDTDTSRLKQQQNGATAIFWNTAKLTKFDEGKIAELSNVASATNKGNITAPWVGLRTKSGKRIYVLSVHFPNASYFDPALGDAGTLKKGVNLTLDWVRSKQADGMVVVMGDFNDNPWERTTYCGLTQPGTMQNTYDMSKGLSANSACPSASGTYAGFRIDHVYVTPQKGQTATAWTHMSGSNATALHASDHTPVYVQTTF